MDFTKLHLSGLHQAPPKIQEEVTDWLRSQGYQAANDDDPFRILRKDGHVLIYALHANDFFRFSPLSYKSLYPSILDRIKKRLTSISDKSGFM
jgi:hypothetical protein